MPGPTVTAVPAPSDVTAFVGALSNFGAALSSGNYGDIKTSAVGLASAATTLSNNPFIKSAGLPGAFGAGISSLQNDINAYNNAPSGSAAAAVATLNILGDVSGLVGAGCTTIATAFPPTAPVTGQCAAWSSVISGISQTAAAAIAGGASASEALTNALGTANSDLYNGMLQDIQTWQAWEQSNNQGEIFIPGQNGQQYASLTLTGLTDLNGTPVTLTDTVSFSGSTNYSQLTATPASGPVSININGTGDAPNISSAIVNLGNDAKISLSGSNDTVNGVQDVVNVNGSGDQIDVSRSNVNIADNLSSAINGSQDVISTGGGDSVWVYGASDFATTQGMFSTVKEYGNLDTFNGNAADDFVYLYGTNEYANLYGTYDAGYMYGNQETTVCYGNYSYCSAYGVDDYGYYENY